MISDQDCQDLITLNRLGELLLPVRVDHAVKVATITRSSPKKTMSPRILQEEVEQQIWIDRIYQAQNEENWTSSQKTYLVGNGARLSVAEAKVCALNCAGL